MAVRVTVLHPWRAGYKHTSFSASPMPRTALIFSRFFIFAFPIALLKDWPLGMPQHSFWPTFTSLGHSPNTPNYADFGVHPTLLDGPK